MKLNQEKGVIIPKGYSDLTEEQKKGRLNKCGPDGFVNKLVPDHILGLDVSEVCNYHDFMYVNSKSKEDLKKADELSLFS